MPVTMPPSWLSRWLPPLALWSALGLFFGLQFQWMYAASGRPIGWGVALGTSFLEWFLWAAFAPLILRLARRFPLERQRWSGQLAIHLAASALLASLHIVLVQTAIAATG